jgi:hypothetical protein
MTMARSQENLALPLPSAAYLTHSASVSLFMNWREKEPLLDWALVKITCVKCLASTGTRNLGISVC